MLINIRVGPTLDDVCADQMARALPAYGSDDEKIGPFGQTTQGRLISEHAIGPGVRL